jgi:hypothetical protein
VVDLAELVSPRRQAEPGADVPRAGEALRSLDGGDERCRGEAMRQLLAGRQRVDAVVLDATMSTNDADSLALHVRVGGLPLVMMSGHSDEVEFAAALLVPRRGDAVSRVLACEKLGGIRQL